MSWYLLRAATRMEHRAVQSLTELRLHAYCPMRTIWDRRAKADDATKKVALFPGYLFALVPDQRGLFGIEEADGVHAFVRTSTDSGRTVLPVPQRLVEGIVLCEALGMFDDTYKPPVPPWEPQKGDAVAVINGPLEGYIGEIVKTKGDKRVKVLFKAMKQAVNLSREDVEPLDVASKCAA